MIPPPPNDIGRYLPRLSLVPPSAVEPEHELQPEPPEPNIFDVIYNVFLKKIITQSELEP
jgi:hypothetical protein